jgi:phage major head subunit gpT-like protein
MTEIGGRRVRLVEAIRAVNSVDVVTRPAAGGSLDRILAAHAEPDILTADERRRYATIVHHNPDGSTEYSFPIPPPGSPRAEGHARTALARLDQSDLTDGEKETVRRRAEAVLAAITHTQEADTLNLDDASTSAPAATTTEPEATTVLQEASSSETATLLEQIRHERDLERSGRLLESTLHTAALPAPIVARLRTRFANRVFTESELDDEISAERETLAALAASGVITGHGAAKASFVAGMNEYEQLQAAFDNMFGVRESESVTAIPRFDGIRSAFRAATGRDIASTGGVDAPLLESFNRGLRGYVRHAIESGTLRESEQHLAHLLETDVTTSTFSYLLGTSMNKRLLKDYQAWPSEWQKFANVVSVKDFKQQDRIRLGAFGSLSQVSEDAPYTTLTLSDSHATYTPAKYGNLVQISRETIINDDLYAIKQIPQKLAVAAAFTLAEFVYEFLDPAGPNVYDGYKLFDATNHKNTGITSGNRGTANSGTALSSAAMQTGTIAMRKQTNAAGKAIGLKPRFLLVPPDLEFSAMTILKSAGLPGGSNNDINPMMGYCEPIVAPQLNSFTTLGATTTFAALVADPRVVDTIEVGFVGGQVNPVLFIQDQPLYGLNFTQDVISYKVRHEYGGAVVDYRGLYLMNN